MLYQLALSLPVGSVKCERSISTLRRVHNYSRVTIQQSRLCELSLLSIESQILETLSVESIIDELASLVLIE